MESGFDFMLYNTLFTDCFIFSSYYKNRNLQLSLFGKEQSSNETSHFADITLNQDSKILKDGEIVVDCKFKEELIPQLINLGVLKKQTGICVYKKAIYPVYISDKNKIKEKEYCMQELIAA